MTDDEQRQKHEEQNFRDAGRQTRETEEAEKACDQCENEEYKGPLQHGQVPPQDG
jgi:hypothetical protein